MRRWVLLALLAALSSVTRGAFAQAAASTGELSSLNVSALVDTGEQIYVAGFDEGLFVLEPNGGSRRLQHAALSPHINALGWSDSTRSLWLGTARGLTLCTMTERHSCARLGPTSAVHAVLVRADGSLVAGSDAGVIFANAGVTQVFGKKQSAPFRSVWALAEAAGKLFVGTTNGLFWGEPSAFVEGGGRLERASVVVGNLPDDWVTALLPLGDRLFVGTYNAGVASFGLSPSGALTPEVTDRALGYVNPAGLFALDAARVAVATMDGLRAGRLGRTASYPTKTRDVTGLLPARGGGYWVATRAGLERLGHLR